MIDSHPARRLTIFVHRASELLTDHESHGDGLICFSLLSGLAKRGHRIFAFTDRVAIDAQITNLTAKSIPLKTPSYALAPYIRSRQADGWLKELERTEKIDIVWRMHPYNANGCPQSPYTGGRPLVLGPLFYEWPDDPESDGKRGKPRLGIGIGSLIRPFGIAGWSKTLSKSSLIFCATEAQANKLRGANIKANVVELPVIVDRPNPINPVTRKKESTDEGLKLIFVGNLVKQKRPAMFCEIIFGLNRKGVLATGTIVGDGPERAALCELCANDPFGKNIAFTGKIANNKVIPLVGECDALVSTSFGEPYGRGIVEAMAAGTPAVCHKSGGRPDFIVNGENGLLVDDLSSDAFVNAILDANNQIDMWSRLSHGALDSSKYWHEDCIIDRLEDELLRVVK